MKYSQYLPEVSACLEHLIGITLFNAIAYRIEKSTRYLRKRRLAIIVKMMLITIEEVMGINSDLLLSSIRRSPGNLPNQFISDGA
jgi:hypothetical protein